MVKLRWLHKDGRDILQYCAYIGPKPGELVDPADCWSEWMTVPTVDEAEPDTTEAPE